MSDTEEYDQRDCTNIISVRKLPPQVTKSDIARVFECFGHITGIYVKYRVAKDSPKLLQHPFANIIFENQDAVDEIMASRPFSIHGEEILVRRFLPKPFRYPAAPNYVSRKAVITVDSKHPDDVLPSDESIVNYLYRFGGAIEYTERLDDQTFLVQFDDYDPVDLSYLMRPHYIDEQLVKIKRCLDEDQLREEVAARQQSHTSLINSTHNDFQETNHSFSPMPVLTFEEQQDQLKIQFERSTHDLEQKHEAQVAAMKAEWRSIAEERIRFQRLTLDYEQEKKQLDAEQRIWSKTFAESMQEKALVQSNGEAQLQQLTERIRSLQST